MIVLNIKPKNMLASQSRTNKKRRQTLPVLDLETALCYTLNNEIPLTKNISSEKLKALQLSILESNRSLFACSFILDGNIFTIFGRSF